jgi:cbb3-type cytochrome oxidase maturation protein
MDEASIALLVMSIALFFIFLGFLFWGLKSKQFNNVEEPKYQLLNKSVNQKEISSETQSLEENKKC